MTSSGIEYRRCDHRAMILSTKFRLHIIMGYIESCYRRLYLAVCQGLSREVRMYIGACQLDEGQIMRAAAGYDCCKDNDDLTRNDTRVTIWYKVVDQPIPDCEKSQIPEISRGSRLLVPRVPASGITCTVRTHKYHWESTKYWWYFVL